MTPVAEESINEAISKFRVFGMSRLPHRVANRKPGDEISRVQMMLEERRSTTEIIVRGKRERSNFSKTSLLLDHFDITRTSQTASIALTAT